MGVTMCSCDKKSKNDLLKDDLIVIFPNHNILITPEKRKQEIEKNKKKKENQNNKENNIEINNEISIEINREIEKETKQNKEIDIYDEKENKENDSLSVNSIIPDQKLHSKNNNEIMFFGDLKNFENKNVISSFATLTRLKLSFYIDKSQFISMKKPISSLNLNQILNADIMKDCENKLFLCLNLIENEEKKLFQTKSKQLLFKWLCVLNYFIPLSQSNKICVCRF